MPEPLVEKPKPFPLLGCAVFVALCIAFLAYAWWVGGEGGRHARAFRMSVQPGMTRVVQAAGRVVRTPNDRGAVVLVCRRFLQTELQQYLPRAWVPEGSSQPWEELAEFFGE